MLHIMTVQVQILGLTLLVYGCHYGMAQEMSAEATDFYDRMQETFQAFFNDQNESTAVWVGVSDPLYGEFFWVYGNASATSPGSTPPNVPATLDQHFDIGSISKTFCGVVVMLFTEQNVLSLSDTVGSLVPDFAEQFPQYEAYQLEDLLRMDTVVADVINVPAGGVMPVLEDNPSVRLSIEELVTIATHLPPTNVTGYSSTNILVAEYIVEFVTGKTMQELVQELILTPLGLNNTAMPARDSVGIRPEPAATPYLGFDCAADLMTIGMSNTTARVGSDITEFSQAVVQFGSAGSFTSTIGDLLHWAQSGTGDSLLSNPMLEKRHMYKNPISDLQTYGITQYIFNPETFAGTGFEGWYGHDGSTFGFSTTALKNDGLGGAAMAVGANSCSFALYAFGLLNAYATELKSRNALPSEAAATMASTTGLTNATPTTTPITTEAISSAASPTASPTTSLSGILISYLIWTFLVLGWAIAA